MQLKEFSLISPVVESGTVLKALEMAIPSVAIEQALTDTHSQSERKRALPSHLVVCLIIAMSLWSKASMRTVLKNLVDGLSTQWVRVGQYWRVPCKSSITEARQRVGCGAITRLFHQVVRPLATLQTPGAFLGGLRIMAVDGTVFDVPDSLANAFIVWISSQPPRNTSGVSKGTFSTVDWSRNTIKKSMHLCVPTGWVNESEWKNYCAR